MSDLCFDHVLAYRPPRALLIVFSHLKAVMDSSGMFFFRGADQRTLKRSPARIFHADQCRKLSLMFGGVPVKAHTGAKIWSKNRGDWVSPGYEVDTIDNYLS